LRLTSYCKCSTIQAADAVSLRPSMHFHPRKAARFSVDQRRSTSASSPRGEAPASSSARAQRGRLPRRLCGGAPQRRSDGLASIRSACTSVGTPSRASSSRPASARRRSPWSTSSESTHRGGSLRSKAMADRRRRTRRRRDPYIQYCAQGGWHRRPSCGSGRLRAFRGRHNGNQTAETASRRTDGDGSCRHRAEMDPEVLL
jgi:hypothetical protein